MSGKANVLFDIDCRGGFVADGRRIHGAAEMFCHRVFHEHRFLFGLRFRFDPKPSGSTRAVADKFHHRSLRAGSGKRIAYRE